MDNLNEKSIDELNAMKTERVKTIRGIEDEIDKIEEAIQEQLRERNEERLLAGIPDYARDDVKAALVKAGRARARASKKEQG